MVRSLRWGFGLVVLYALPCNAYAGGIDPTGSSVLVTAVNWVEGTLLGTVATVVAIIAVAAIGFQTLTGRIPVRRGGTVVAGCFVVFGAHAIATGLLNAVRSDADVAAVPREMGDDTSPLIGLTGGPPTQYDPYAGAAIRRR